MTEQDAENAVNALKNRYHLIWCWQTDLPGYGGINWFAPSGKHIGGTDALPTSAVRQLEELIMSAGLQEPEYCKPLNKCIVLQADKLPEDAELEYDSFVPVKGHPGAFGTVRKNHIHEGIDLYANSGDRVYAMVAGRVVGVEQFTGEAVGSPWWNDTWAVAIEDETGVWIYGEIRSSLDIKVGDDIRKGQDIGSVAQVLKVDKGRPMSMLHLERYAKGTTKSIGLWELNTPQPEGLLDPHPELIKGLCLE